MYIDKPDLRIILVTSTPRPVPGTAEIQLITHPRDLVPFAMVGIESALKLQLPTLYLYMGYEHVAAQTIEQIMDECFERDYLAFSPFNKPTELVLYGELLKCCQYS